MNQSEIRKTSFPERPGLSAGWRTARLAGMLALPQSNQSYAQG